MPILEIKLLGGVSLEQDGESLPDVKSQKGRALLCYLAVSEKQAARPYLAALFWPDMPESNARRNLRKVLQRLRPLKPYLVITHETVAFDQQADYWLDVAEFEEGTAVPQDIPRLQKAIALYQGDFLAGLMLPDSPLFEEWVLAQRARLREMALVTLHRLVAHFREDGVYEIAIAYGRQLLAIEPWHEETHRELMRLLALSGQRSAALAQFETCRTLLADELGVKPEAATVRLMEQIRAGEFRGEEEQRAISPPHSLPPQMTPFVGRERELARLEELLTEPNVHLITILAPGGMGKTRLALKAASTQQFEDGVFFIPLAPLKVSENLVTTISENIGFMLHGDHPPKQQLLDHLSGKTILLVLDNFEHLLDGTSLVSDILFAAPKIKILVTSRERLNLHGETVYPLFGLHYLVGTHQDDILAYDAAKLFIQSARCSQVGFDIETSNFESLIRICQLTEGMPLALELAAGWVDTLSVKQIAAELQQGIDILKTELRDVPDRHRSIRATFERTWKRMTENEQAIFAKLSLFRGGFTFHAAQKIAGADAQSVRRLVQKALIHAEIDERFSIHELLRQFGAEQLLRIDEAGTIHDTHARYYMSFLAERGKDITGYRQIEGLQKIRSDFENIRQAWIWALEYKQVELLGGTLGSLTNFAEMNFSFVEVLELLDQALDTFDSLPDELSFMVRDGIVIRRELLHWLLGREIDTVIISEVLLRMRNRDAKHEIAFCLYILALHAERTRDDNALEAYSEECLALWRLLEEPFYVSMALGIRGHSYKKKDDIAKFLDCWAEIVRIERQLGTVTKLCASLCVLGWLKTFYGDFAEAGNLQNEALAVQSRIGRKVPYNVFIVGQKANLAFWRGEFSNARHYIQAGLDFADGRDYLGVQPFYLSMLSWMASVDGDYERGYALCKPALDNLLPNTTMYIMWALTLAACGLGRYQEAQQALRQALDAARDFTRGPTHQQLCLPVAAILKAHDGQTQQAAQLIGLIQTAPEQLMGWLERWGLFQDICKQVSDEMGEEIYAELTAIGANLELDSVVEELLGW